MSVLTKSAHTQRALFSADVHTAKYIFVWTFMHVLLLLFWHFETVIIWNRVRNKEKITLKNKNHLKMAKQFTILLITRRHKDIYTLHVEMYLEIRRRGSREKWKMKFINFLLNFLKTAWIGLNFCSAFLRFAHVTIDNYKVNGKKKKKQKFVVIRVSSKYNLIRDTDTRLLYISYSALRVKVQGWTNR